MLVFCHEINIVYFILNSYMWKWCLCSVQRDLYFCEHVRRSLEVKRAWGNMVRINTMCFLSVLCFLSISIIIFDLADVPLQDNNIKVIWKSDWCFIWLMFHASNKVCGLSCANLGHTNSEKAPWNSSVCFLNHVMNLKPAFNLQYSKFRKLKKSPSISIHWNLEGAPG